MCFFLLKTIANAGPLIENQETLKIEHDKVDNQKKLPEKSWTFEDQKKAAFDGKAAQKNESEPNSDEGSRNAQNQTQFKIDGFWNITNENVPVELSDQSIHSDLQNADKNRTNSEIQRDFQLLVTEVARRESTESVHYDCVVQSLIKFIKFLIYCHIETDFTSDQAIELARIFQRVIKIKSELLQNLFRIAWNLRHSKSVAMAEVNAAMEKITCLHAFNACINLEVIAQRLSSPKVRA